MRIGLASPVFHGYWRSIAHGLRQNGHTVRALAYDARPGPWRKASGKVQQDLPRQLGFDVAPAARRRTSRRVARWLAEQPMDLLIVVKGDEIDPAVVERTRSQGTRSVLWLYDSLEAMPGSEESFGAYDVIASYSETDTQLLRDGGWNVLHLPNAFDERLPAWDQGMSWSPDVVFVGSRYGGREALLDRLVGQGLEVRAYGRDWSHHPVDRIRTLTWHRPSIPWGRDLPRDRAVLAMARAAVALSPHEQGGLTMRTFEAAGSGSLQAVDRSDVAAAYEPGAEVLVYGDASELADIVARARRDPAWAARIRAAARRRTLAEHTFRHRCSTLLAAC